MGNTHGSDGGEVTTTAKPSTSACAAFAQWPHVDDGVTCGACTALVLTAQYGGKCDVYCQSFGHICTSAAEEQDENCDVKYQAQCDQEITGTSDMLCTCEYVAGEVADMFQSID